VRVLAHTGKKTRAASGRPRLRVDLRRRALPDATGHRYYLAPPASSAGGSVWERWPLHAATALTLSATRGCAQLSF